MLTIRRIFQMWQATQRLSDRLLASKDPANFDYATAVTLACQDVEATPLEHLAMHKTLMELKDLFVEEAIKLKSDPLV